MDSGQDYRICTYVVWQGEAMRTEDRIKVRIKVVLMLGLAASLGATDVALAQDSCASLRAYISQLNQQVQMGLNSRAPREQVNHDINLRNRTAQIYNQRCSGGGGGGYSSGGSGGGNRLGAAIGLLGLFASMIDAANASAAERERQEEVERRRVFEELQRAHEEMYRLEQLAKEAGAEAVKQQAQTQADQDRTWRESQPNPFPAPSHRIDSPPFMNKVEVALVRPERPVGQAKQQGCPSDTPGAKPNAKSLSPECMKGRIPARKEEHAGSAGENKRVPSGAETGTLDGRKSDGQVADGKEINVVVGNAQPIPPFVEKKSSTSGRAEQATQCVKVGEWTFNEAWHSPTYPREKGAPGTYWIENTCSYRVHASACVRVVPVPGGVSEVCDQGDIEPGGRSTRRLQNAALEGESPRVHYYACRATWPQYNRHDFESSACAAASQTWLRSRR